jgi:hypothetical protein
MPANDPAGTGAVIGIHDHDIAAAPADGSANVERRAPDCPDCPAWRLAK